MKEFNLEEAKNGKEVCTRDGHAARIICFDRKSNIKYDNLIALITNDNNIEIAYYYDNNGKFCDCKESKNDLVMKPTKHVGWLNIYSSERGDILLGSNIFNTEEEAIANGKNYRTYITTTKIEWEE